MNSSTRIGATYSGAQRGGYLGEAPTGTNIAESGSGAKGGRARYSTGLTSAKTGGYGSNGSWGQRLSNNIGSDVKGEAYQGAHIMIIADTITGFNQAAISTGGEKGYTVSEEPHRTVGYGGGAGCGGNGSGADSDAKNAGKGGYNGGGGGAFFTWKNSSTIYYTGGSGGSSGWAFIWCNNVVNQDTTDTVLFD